MGVLNTLTTYVVYLLLTVWMHYQVAYVIAYVFGIVFSYFLNAKFVFSVALSSRGLMLFPIVYLVQYLICFVAMFILVEKINLDYKVAPFIVTILTIPLTYRLSKWVLTNKKVNG